MISISNSPEDIHLTPLYNFCADPSEQIFIIKESFAKVIKTNGPDTWRPFAIFLENPFRSSLVVQSRDVSGYEDTLKSVSEIYSIYAAMNAYSSILVLDVGLKDEDSLYKDALKLFFISGSDCQIVTIPYKITEHNDVLYSEEKYQIDPISVDNFSEEYKDLYIILFTYSHVNETPYQAHEVLSYLTSIGHIVQYIPGTSYHPYLSFDPSI